MAKKALLMILDGWGIGKHGKGDVIFNTPTPYLDLLTATSAHSQLQASGEDVGLGCLYLCQGEQQEAALDGSDLRWWCALQPRPSV